MKVTPLPARTERAHPATIKPAPALPCFRTCLIRVLPVIDAPRVSVSLPDSSCHNYTDKAKKIMIIYKVFTTGNA
jgi:hypothetical protein